MNSKFYIVTITFILLAFSIFGAGAESYKIPFETENGLMLIAAELEGESGYFIFDSGADALLLNSTVQQSKLIEFTTLSGRVIASETTIKDLSLGSYNKQNILAYSANLATLQEQLDGQLLGILGIGFFESEILQIDNVNKVIELYTVKKFHPEITGNYYKVAVSIEADLLMIPLRIDDTEYQFMLDTGSSVSIIDAQVISANAAMFSSLNKLVSVNTAYNETLNSEVVQVSTIKMAKVTINDLQFGVTDLSSIQGQLPDNFAGILSLDQLPVSELVIDFNAKNLYFKF